jgi:outer membrane protein assembly factor BamB
MFLVFILISTVAVAGCKISGVITNSDGVGVEGVTVILDCDDSVEGCDASMSTTTDADGTYVFHKIKPGNYKVKPADDKHTFEPASKNVNVGYKKMARADFEIVTSPAPPSPVSLPPWSTYQGNAAHTGYVPVFLDTANFKEAWVWPDDGTELVPLNPVAAGDGKVFVTTAWESGANVLIALDSAGPVELWRYDFGEIDSVNPPAYANGTVYIQSGVGDDSNLWAFDAEAKPVDKEPISSYLNQSFLFYAPTVYEEQVDNEVKVGVYMGGSYLDKGESYMRWYGGVYGFSFGGVDEKELWHKPLPPYEQWTPAVNKDYVITYTGPYDYFIAFDSLNVFNRKTGEFEFSIPDPNFVWKEFDQFSMDLAPVLGSLNNIIVINGGRLISFDLAKQKIGWEIPKKEGDLGSFSGQPSLANGIIYAVSEGYLYALDESDGSPIEGWLTWQPPLEGESIVESIVTPMIVTDNLIFVSTASKTYAVDLESQTAVWSYDAGGHLALSDDGILYIATTEGELHAISTIATPEE